MKIDPRKKALQVQCVNCGYCIDSCKERFDSKNKKGKNLFYSFGLDEDKKNKVKNRPFFYKAAIALFLLLASFLIFFFKFSNYHYLNQSIFNINQNYFTRNPKMFGNKYKLIVENGSNETKRLKIKVLSSKLKLHFLTKSKFKIEPHSSLTLYPVLYILKNETKENFKKGPYPLIFQIINSKNTIISEKNTVFFITKIFNNKK
jgi:Ubp3 associated protein Bre5.